MGTSKKIMKDIKERKLKKKKSKKRMQRSTTLGAMDFNDMFASHSSSKKKDDEYYKKMRQDLKKAGPRQIGKIKYKGIKVAKRKKLKSKRDDSKRSRSSTGIPVPRIMPKLGPRDIGKIKYDGLKLSEEEKAKLESSKFLEDTVSHKTRKAKRTNSGKNLFGAKLGPQEIGRIKYKGTKLTKKQKEELKRRQVLEDRVHHKTKRKRKIHERSRSLVGTKLGPIDVGKNKNYKGTKIENDSDDENRDILSEKTHIVIKKKWHLAQKSMEFDDDLNLDDDESYDDEMDLDSENETENTLKIKNGKPPTIDTSSSSQKKYP